MEDTAKPVEASGAISQETRIDLLDTEAALDVLIHQDDEMCFDIAYLVAGVGDTRAVGETVESPEQILRTAQINFAVPAAMAAALADRMAQRGGGRIVLIGSAAGHHSLPFAGAYSASKAGLARFSDALRLAVKPQGVSVTLVAPGFLNTNDRAQEANPPPFLLSVDDAARRIIRAGAKGHSHYVTPWPFQVLRALDVALPGWLRDQLLVRLKP